MAGLDISSVTPPCALTLAGSDSCAGAGIQADLKTFAAHGVYGASVITAVTAQNTRSVLAVEPVSAQLIWLQARAVLDDLPIAAIKIGMLPDAPAIDAVAQVLDGQASIPSVLDTVMVASSGQRLMDASVLAHFRMLMTKVALVTPNLAEAKVLLDWESELDSRQAMEAAAKALLRGGVQRVLLKGGHLPGEECADLYVDDQILRWFSAPKLTSVNTHGTGCTLSAAIAARLAKGDSFEQAIDAAKTYITQVIRGGVGWRLGRGVGPLNHFSGTQDW